MADVTAGAGIPAKRITGFAESFFRELPQLPVARWASIFFTLSVLTYLFSIAVTQAFLALAAICYAVYWFREHPRVEFPPIKLPLLLFCALTVISVFWATNETVGWFAVRKLVLFLIFALAVNLIVSLRHLAWIYKALFAESAVVGAVGIAQFIEQYRLDRALHPQAFYSYMITTRITGLMGHWMNFGGQQMLIFAVFAAFLLLSKPVRKFWWLVMLVTIASIILNLTRGVWLGCFVAVIYIVARWRARWLLVLPVLVLAGYFFAPRLVRERAMRAFHPSQAPALSMRFEIWHTGARMVRRHPWVGVGPNNIPEVYMLYVGPGVVPEAGYHGHMHDNVLQFAAERGLPCMVAWIWLMLALLLPCFRIRREAGSRWFTDGAIAAWLAFVLEGLFEFNFGTSPVLMVFLFVSSTPFIVERLQTRPQPLEPPVEIQHV